MKTLIKILCLLCFCLCQDINDLTSEQLKEYNFKKITVQPYTKTIFSDNLVRYDVYEGFEKIELNDFLMMIGYVDLVLIKEIENNQKIHKKIKRLRTRLMIDLASFTIGIIGGISDAGYTIPFGVFGMVDGPITLIRLFYNKTKVKNNPGFFEVPYNKMIEMANDYNNKLYEEIKNSQ